MSDHIFIKLVAIIFLINIYIFKQSADMVTGQFWIILTLVILITVIQAIGGSIVVGTLVIIPYTSLLAAHFYLALNRENTEQVGSIT